MSYEPAIGTGDELPFRRAWRPVMGGISGGHAFAGSGTLGCRCRSTRLEDAACACVLSCNHVFGNLNAAAEGETLFQPSRLEVCAPPLDEPFATFLRTVPIRVDGPNEVDAAIGRLMVDMTDEVYGIGTITGTTSGERLMPVRKHGRSTGLTEGVITNAHYTHIVQVRRTGQSIQFVNQLKIESTDTGRAFASAGDSGAVVLGPGNKVVGLLFAIDRNADGQSYVVCNRIELVEKHLQIQIP